MGWFSKHDHDEDEELQRREYELEEILEKDQLTKGNRSAIERELESTRDKIVRVDNGGG